MFRPKPSAQSAMNRGTYIPPAIAQAINKEVSANLPTTMQQYMQGGYVPPQAQKIIAKQMDHLPTHLKQYSGAYMEQAAMQPRSFQPNMTTPTTTTVQPHPPLNLMRQGRSGVVPGEQPRARLTNGLFASEDPTASTGSGATPPPSEQQTNYDFFMSSGAPQKTSKFNLLNGQSLRKRLMVVAGGIVVLIIVIVVLSSLFGGKGPTSLFIPVSQDQNELVRVATEATSEESADQTTQNLAQTIQLSLSSAQQQLLTYLKSNGETISAQQLAATKNLKTDQELTAAQAASNFDPVFTQVVQTGLQSYMNDIKSAYKQAGPKGKVLLQNEYNGALLLQKQTAAAITSLQQ